MAEAEIKQYQSILLEIDQLHDALTNLSKYPIATRAILATLEERYNTLAFELEKIAENETAKKVTEDSL